MNMKWHPVDRTARVQPESGSYQTWKSEIRTACGHKCVYCALHESRNGGERNYHVEHFRPKSREEFGHLKNDIFNLYLSCAICNCFKGADWPGEPEVDLSTATYADPADTDYNEIFDIEAATCLVSGSVIAAEFMKERLYLNRPQLLAERRLSQFLEKQAVLKYRLRQARSRADETTRIAEFRSRIDEILDRLHDLAIGLLTAVPYHAEDRQRLP